MRQSESFKNAILGFAVGDALGCPVEYEAREWLDQSPVEGMRSQGTHGQPAGTWTDDTQMMLAALDAICDAGGVDPEEIMKRLLLWYDEGVYTPYGVRFDIGLSIEASFLTYRAGIPLALCGGRGERDNGSAALSRAIPVCLYLRSLAEAGAIGPAEAISQLDAVTAISHAHRRSLLACGLLYFFIRSLTGSVESIATCLQRGMDEAFAHFTSVDPTDELELVHFSRFRDMAAFAETPRDWIRSTGYVVDALEAVLWSILTTESYRDAVLRAVNLGGDADTIGGLTGALAGIYYGVRGIPGEWRATLARREWIEALCGRADEAVVKAGRSHGALRAALVAVGEGEIVAAGTEPLSAQDSPDASGDAGIRRADAPSGSDPVGSSLRESTGSGGGAALQSRDEKGAATVQPMTEQLQGARELALAASLRERLEAELRLLRARIELLTAERDDLVYRECRELQAEYDRKIGSLEQQAMEAELAVRALKRMIELMQAQINREEVPDYDSARARAEEEYQRYEEELKKRAERIRREEEHARKRQEQERKSQKAGRKDGGPEREAEGEESEALGSEDLTRELKSLYRRIVKKLHPDVNHDVTEREKELFQRAVKAYEMGDLETLREIAARIEDDDWFYRSRSSDWSMERLLEMRERLREQIEALNEEILHIRRSFPCSAKAFLRDPDKVQARQRELRESIEAYRAVEARLRERIAGMREASEKKRGKKRRARDYKKGSQA